MTLSLERSRFYANIAKTKHHNNAPSLYRLFTRNSQKLVSWQTDVERLKFGVTFKSDFKRVQMNEGNSLDLLAF